nr:MAG TPA: hypothetical protein [Caudoviricetes sp.]
MEVVERDILFSRGLESFYFFLLGDELNRFFI